MLLAERKGGHMVRGRTTKAGFENGKGQMNLGCTGRRSETHPAQYVYVMQCGACSYTYGSNGSVIHSRKCPKCGEGGEGPALLVYEG